MPPIPPNAAMPNATKCKSRFRDVERNDFDVCIGMRLGKVKLLPSTVPEQCWSCESVDSLGTAGEMNMRERKRELFYESVLVFFLRHHSLSSHLLPHTLVYKVLRSCPQYGYAKL